MKTPQTPLRGSAWIEQIKADAEAGRISEKTIQALEPSAGRVFSRAHPSSAADKKVAISKRVGQNWEKLSGEQKAGAAMWAAGALLGAFATVSAARSAFTRDDDGQIHAEWSHVGVALLQATLAAGCAYCGVQALHARTL